MKLSVWSSYYIELSPEDAILAFKEHGYEYCELSDEHAFVLMARGDPKVVGQRFKEFSNDHHVSFTQGHLSLKARICDNESIEILKKQLDLFIAIGIKYAVLHCDSMPYSMDISKEEKQARNACALRQLTEYIRGKDLVICLENMTKTSITQSAKDLLYYIELLGSENLGICLDTGHLNLSGCQSQADFIKTAGTHIKALHLADNEGVYDQHIMPFGKGKVDFHEVITELKKIGYDGLYNFELPGERKAPRAIKGYKLDYIKKMFKYLYNEVCI